MDELDDDLTRMIDGLRTGNTVAVVRFWQYYGPLLHKLADRNIASGLKRRFGPDDIAQSACRTFFRRAQLGEFQFDDDDALWRLLCAITLTKIREKNRFHTRLKRSLRLERPIDTGDSTGGMQLPAGEPDPADVVEFGDLLESTLARLDDEERSILELRLQDCKQEEIAKKLNCSERTVRRILKRIQENFSAWIDRSEG